MSRSYPVSVSMRGHKSQASGSHGLAVNTLGFLSLQCYKYTHRFHLLSVYDWNLKHPHRLAHALNTQFSANGSVLVAVETWKCITRRYIDIEGSSYLLLSGLL